jgi:hypothetical protein
MSWLSQQQINNKLCIIIMISAEAELNALVVNIKETLWLRRIIDNLRIKQDLPTNVYGDNTSSMLIVNC